MHFLVAFAPKIHVQLEFSLVSKIDLASASRAVCQLKMACYQNLLGIFPNLFDFKLNCGPPHNRNHEGRHAHVHVVHRC